VRRPRAILALLFGLLLTLLASASAFVIQADAIHVGAGDGRESPQNWRLLIDQSGRLSIDEVLAQRGLFQRLDDLSIAAPASDAAVWLQVSLPPFLQPNWLRISAPRVQYLDYYQLRDGRLERHIETGEMRSQEARLPSRAYLFSLPNDFQPREAYVRLQSNHPLMAWFKVIDEVGLLQQTRPAYLFGALFGALGLLTLHNLLRFAYTFNFAYVWLGLMHAALLSCALANVGLFAVWAPGLSYNQPLIADLSALVACAALLVFALRFFHRRGGNAMNWLLGTELNLVAGLAGAIFVSQALWYSGLIYSLVALVCLSITLVALHHWRNGFRPARLVAAGMLLMNVCFVFTLPVLLGYQQLAPGWVTGIVFSITTLAGLILSYALLELQRQNIALQRSQTTAEAVSSAELRTKADFLAKISHEIRTPMNGVLGMSELLLGTSLSAKQRDYVLTIHSSGNELLNLINEIFDISRLESGQIEIDDVQFDLAALIDDCVSIFSAKAEQQKVELVGFVKPGTPHVISGDPSRLRQALLNLLENALKQTDEGEVLLLAETEGPDQAPRLRLSVRDSGTPLDPQERDALLGTRLDQHDFLGATRQAARLGLIVARQLSTLMDGEFGLDSSEQGGNCLWISLPLAPELLRQPHVDLDAALQGARLLVVDDNDTCRKVISQQCNSWGMEVATVASGREALALLRTKAHLREYFDVVLLDQDMPGMTGMQLASKIKEDRSINHDILLIMLTGMSHAPSKIIARNAGIKRILAKPVAGYTLRTTLADELGRRYAGVVMAASAPPATGPLAAPQDFRILVAEDNSISTKVIRGMLAKLQLNPDTASNGEEALAAIKAHPYDLVLMDCDMPVLDGFAATARLREWERAEGRQRTPVVALTAHILSEHRERAREAGMDGHMTKPVELSQLRDVIEHWMHVKAASSAG
jgi:CheY-like chemotaxis protein